MQEYLGRTLSSFATVISSLLGSIMQAFCVLNHIEYDAPWRSTVLKRPIR
jgi:hypothetical protein